MSVDAAKARTSEKAAVLRSEQTNEGSFARKWCREIEKLRGKTPRTLDFIRQNDTARENPVVVIGLQL